MSRVTILLVKLFLVVLLFTILAGCEQVNHGIRSPGTIKIIVDTVPTLPPKMVDKNGDLVCDRDFGKPHNSLFILPYKTTNSAYLIQSYCFESNSHHDRFAIDFGLGFKDTVIAARTGVLRTVVEYYDDFDYTYGHHNYVTVLHSDGTLGFYAHLANLSVLLRSGDTIHQGEALALNGTSGMPYYLPCLHFEVLYDTLVFDRSNSVSVNFRNAIGPLNSNNGVADSGSVYTAGEFISNDL